MAAERIVWYRHPIYAWKHRVRATKKVSRSTGGNIFVFLFLLIFGCFILHALIAERFRSVS